MSSEKNSNACGDPGEVAASLISEAEASGRLSFAPCADTPALDLITFTRAELVDLLAQGIGRATSPVAAARCPPFSGGGLIPVQSIQGSGAPAPPLAPFPSQAPAPAFNITIEGQSAADRWLKLYVKKGSFDPQRQMLFITPAELRDICVDSMLKVPQGNQCPLGSWQSRATFEEDLAQGAVRLTVTSSRGMGFSHRIGLYESRRAQFGELIDFVLRHGMEPDEMEAMLHAGADVIAGEDRALETDGVSFDAQSMIDLKVEAASVVERATEDKFWGNGRLRTHENKLIEKLLTDVRASILALDPDAFTRKESA